MCGDAYFLGRILTQNWCRLAESQSLTYVHRGGMSCPGALKIGRFIFGNRATIAWTYSGPFCWSRNSQLGYHLACSSHGSSSFFQFCKPPLQ